MKERKEYAVGATALEAVKAFDETHGQKHGQFSGGSFGHEKFEVVQDVETKLHQVFRKRTQRDRTVKRPIIRESASAFANYGPDRRNIVLIVGRETIGMNLKGRRSASAKHITWVDLYRYLCQCEALAKGRAKQKARADKRKAAAAKRKGRR